MINVCGVISAALVPAGIAIGGDVFPGSTLSDHCLRYQNIPEIKMIVVLGELGGQASVHPVYRRHCDINCRVQRMSRPDAAFYLTFISSVILQVWESRTLQHRDRQQV